MPSPVGPSGSQGWGRAPVPPHYIPPSPKSGLAFPIQGTLYHHRHPPPYPLGLHFQISGGTRPSVGSVCSSSW